MQGEDEEISDEDGEEANPPVKSSDNNNQGDENE